MLRFHTAVHGQPFQIIIAGKDVYFGHRLLQRRGSAGRDYQGTEQCHHSQEQ